MKIFFETDELSEKSLSFLLFEQLIPRENLRNFIEWLEEEEFFFDYDAVFDKFDEMFLRLSLKTSATRPLKVEEVPTQVVELADH